MLSLAPLQPTSQLPRIIDPVVEGPPDILDGLLPKQGQLLISGETNVGKTLVALEICAALTTETPLWGLLHPTAKVSKILYVLGEHYNEVIQRLWRKTELPMGPEALLLGPETLRQDKILMSHGRVNTKAIDTLKTYAEGSDFIVFDPLSSFITGVDSENDNVQMRQLLDAMSHIAQVSGASSLILAHQGKPSIDPFTGEARARNAYAIRGASAIEDAATNIFYMNKVRQRKQKLPFGPSPPPELMEEDTTIERDQLFELVCRKYKGPGPEGGKFRLVRPAGKLYHHILTGGGRQPFSELKRKTTRDTIERLQKSFPDASKTDLVRMLAAVEETAESTIWHRLAE